LYLAAGDAPEDKMAALDSAAATVELLHLATLIHDDVVDQAPLRRGEPALHRQFGPSKAVLYGDWMFAQCFRMISTDVSADSARSLADLVSVMAGSEILQWNDRFRLPVSQRRILRKTMGKTAVLFSLALYTGAHEAGKPAAQALAYRRAGYALGMAFQLQDDLLDWTARESQLGKPVLEDLTSGIYTWPVTLAWADNAERTRKELLDVRDGRLEPAALRDLWSHRGYWNKTEALIQVYLDRARRDLSRACGADEQAQWDRLVKRLSKRSR
jgi:heptaprenyl diphosphate synthase